MVLSLWDMTMVVLLVEVQITHLVVHQERHKLLNLYLLEHILACQIQTFQQQVEMEVLEQ
ncbi:MAG: hypothetical protein CME98_23330 [Hyphomonas sp.]|nr:hypothetical protein [Hyphomonas sp.]